MKLFYNNLSDFMVLAFLGVNFLIFLSKGGSLGVLPLGEKGRKDHSLPLLHAHSGMYHFSSLLSKLLSVFCG